jgi:hypothetical protein
MFFIVPEVAEALLTRDLLLKRCFSYLWSSLTQNWQLERCFTYFQLPAIVSAHVHPPPPAGYRVAHARAPARRHYRPTRGLASPANASGGHPPASAAPCGSFHAPWLRQ